jgi:hypothetical protein
MHTNNVSERPLAKQITAHVAGSSEPREKLDKKRKNKLGSLEPDHRQHQLGSFEAVYIHV